MFERYTERARRVVFFARFEASQCGSMTIETEHLLLGLLRENKNIVNRFLQSGASESIRDAVTARLTVRQRVPSAIDLPLSAECKHILGFAAEEADRQNHQYIGTEHVLLGIIREEKCGAAQVLIERGLNVETMRAELAREPISAESGRASHEAQPLISFLQHQPVLPESGVVPDAETAKIIAEAIWIPLYGAETVASQTPLRAERKFNAWLVTGSQAAEGALFAYILQTDGRILSVGRGPLV